MAQTTRRAVPRNDLSTYRRCSVKDDTLSWRHRITDHSPLIAEFVGSLVQALAWNCTELGKESSKAGEWKPLILGLTLMVSTYSLAAISGAHLNPAVSISVGLSNMGEWTRLMRYMVVQFLGSGAGVFLACATYRKTKDKVIGPQRDGFSISDCMLTEFFFTAMVCTIYINVMLSKSNNSVKAGNQFYGLAIGLGMAAACWAVEDISGAIFNPGIAFFADFQSIKTGVGNGVAYMIAEILGAFLAAAAYRVMRPVETNRDNDHLAMSQRSMQEVSGPCLAAEGAGTFLVVFTFGMCLQSKLYHQERPFAAAAALASMHYSLADISGGHFNPAVTLSVMMSGRNKCSVHRGVAYIAVQIVSGALAAFFYSGIVGETSPAVSPEAAKKYGALQMSMVDSFFAFIICYAFLSFNTTKALESKLDRNYFGGLAYGLSSATGGFALLKLLNSLANPAMTLGVVLSYAIFHGGDVHVAEALSISSFQLFGAIGAAMVFRCTHAEHYRRLKEEESTPLVDQKQDSGIFGSERSTV